MLNRAGRAFWEGLASHSALPEPCRARFLLLKQCIASVLACQVLTGSSVKEILRIRQEQEQGESQFTDHITDP